MANNSRLKKIAQKITKIEKDKKMSFDEKEHKIMNLVQIHNLKVEDLMKIDDMIINILDK